MHATLHGPRFHRPPSELAAVVRGDTVGHQPSLATNAAEFLRHLGSAQPPIRQQSLGTRDLHRASGKLAKLEDEPKSADSQRKRQPIAHAIQAFHESTRDLSHGTKRNYVRILRFLEQFTTTRGLETIDQIDLETLNAFLLPEDQLSDLSEEVAGSATLLPFLCGLRLDREESRQARDGA